jgi:hypothetical protein
MSFPKQVEELTLDWLNRALVEKRVLTTQRLVHFETEPFAQGGTAGVYLIRLTYEPEPLEAPKTVIAKFASADKQVREAISRYRGFEREVGFYRRFGDDAGIPTPRCFAAEYDPEDHTSVLLLELVGRTCTRDLLAGTSADIEMAVDHLGLFHAKWWGKEDQLTDVYSDYCDEFLQTRIQNVSLAAGKINAGFREFVCRPMLLTLDRWVPHAREISEYSRRRPQTLCHGSFHRGQILFPLAVGDPFRVIDWQTVSINFGATDLARIIVCGLLPEQRREHERALVERYHAILVEQGVTQYPLDELWDDYRLGIAATLILHVQGMAVYDIQAMVGYWGKQGLPGTSIWDVFFTWPGEAAEDHQVVEFLDRVIGASTAGRNAGIEPL